MTNPFKKTLCVLFAAVTVLCCAFCAPQALLTTAKAAGDSIANAETVVFDQTYYESISKIYDSEDDEYYSEDDYFEFTLPSAGKLTYKITSYIKCYDTYIYGSDGKEIFESDENWWVSTTEMRTDTYTIDLLKGTYYIKVTGSWYDYTGDYNFKLSFKSAGENIAEPNNSINQARTVKFDKTYKGQIAINDKNDYIKITLPSSGRLTYKITSYIERYSTYLYNADGYEIWGRNDNNWVSTTGRRTDTYVIDLAKGTYYIKIAGTWDDYTGNYNFKLSFKSANESLAEPNNSINEAKTIKFAQSYNGQIAINDKEDYYIFTMPTSGKVVLNITSYLERYSVFIYDINGYEIWSSTGNLWIGGSGKRTDKHEINLSKGIFYIKVQGTWNDYTGNYTFKLSRKVSVGSVKGLKAAPGTSSIKLSWNKTSGASGYAVYKYDNAKKKYVFVANTTATSYTFKKLKAGTTYTYAVKAYKSLDGAKYYGSQAAIKTTTKPSAPSISLKAGTKQVTVSWKKISGATSYTVYYSTSKNGTFKSAGTATGSSLTVKKLAGKKTYYFKAVANRKVGGVTVKSAASAVKSIKTK